MFGRVLQGACFIGEGPTKHLYDSQATANTVSTPTKARTFRRLELKTWTFGSCADPIQPFACFAL